MNRLIEKGLDINKQVGPARMTVAMMAAAKGDAELLTELLQKGAKPDIVDVNGWSAGMHAAKVGKLEAIKVLIKHGADTTLEGVGGANAKMIASSYLRIDVCTFLDQYYEQNKGRKRSVSPNKEPSGPFKNGARSSVDDLVDRGGVGALPVAPNNTVEQFGSNGNGSPPKNLYSPTLPSSTTKELPR